MTGHFPIPLGDPPHQPDDAAPNPWGIERIEPTDLITLWPGDEAPRLDDVLAALRAHCKGKIEVIAEPPAESCAHIAGEGNPLWAAILQLPESDGHCPVPLVMWAEPMRDLSDETIKHLKAESIKWALGVETLLRPDDPTGHFMKLLRLLGRAAPQSPGILDVNKHGWHLREELDELLLPEENIVSESILWFTHAVGTDAPPTPDSKLWIYTQGLHRCGVPELEMLEVPYPMAGSAVALVNAIGELVVEGGIPDPGESLDVGDQLALTLHPWQEVAQHVDEKLPGHVNNRKDHDQKELIGPRAAICGIEPTGSYRKIWTWPAEVVQHLAMTGMTALYKTKFAAGRQRQLAISTWNDLVNAFAAIPPELRRDSEHRQAVFLVQAGFQKPPRKKAGDAGDNHGCEHLWCEVKRFHSAGNARVEAQLVNEPFELPHLHQGDRVQIDKAIVSDWQVMTRRGLFGPSNVGGLHETIRQIIGAGT